MDKRAHGWLRPALAIAVLGALAGALLASPVSAHFAPKDEKKHEKKIARRIAKKEATTIVQTTVGPTVFIEETELTRFGQVKLSVGAADQTVATVGPFTLRASCEDADAGASVSIRAELELVTSESNSVAITEDDTDTDFDTGEEFIWGGGNFGDAPGDRPIGGRPIPKATPLPRAEWESTGGRASTRTSPELTAPFTAT